jgi:hypothetical protein
VVVNRRGRLGADRDLEERLADARSSPAGPEFVHDRAHLLVARSLQSKRLSDETETSIRLRDRLRPIVQALERRDEARVDPRGDRRHFANLAAAVPRKRNEFEPFLFL